MAEVQSIQRDSVTYASGDGTDPTAITLGSSVVLNQSVLTFSQRNSNSDQRLKRHVFTGVLTASTIQFSRNQSSHATSVTIEWEVVEYDSSVFVQRGTSDLTAATTNISITTVDDTASFAVFSFKTSLDSLLNNVAARSSITSSGANVTFDLDTAPTTGQCEIAWQVVEFAGADANVQMGTIALSSSEGTKTKAITSVTAGDTFLVHGGISSNQSTDPPARNKASLELNSATEIEAKRNSIATLIAMDVSYYVVEMLDGTTVERGAVTITDTNTTPSTQPSFTAMSNPSLMLGQTAGNLYPSSATPDTNPGHNYATLSVDGTDDGLTIQRNLTNKDLYVPWFAIDWNAAGGAGLTGIRNPMKGPIQLRSPFGRR